MPLAVLTGLATGSFALLGSARPVRAPARVPVVSCGADESHYCGGRQNNLTQLFLTPVPSHGIVDADGRTWDLVDIPGQTLRGLDLRNTEWVCVDLHGATFLYCGMRGADLRNSDLRGLRIWQCELDGADLTEADVQGARYTVWTSWGVPFP